MKVPVAILSISGFRVSDINTLVVAVEEKTHTIAPAIPERRDCSDFYNITSIPPRARECPPASKPRVLPRPKRLPLLAASKIRVC